MGWGPKLAEQPRSGIEMDLRRQHVPGWPVNVGVGQEGGAVPLCGGPAKRVQGHRRGREQPRRARDEVVAGEKRK